MEEVFLEENDEEGQDRAQTSFSSAGSKSGGGGRGGGGNRGHDWVSCSTLLWLVREDPADPQEEAEEAQAVEEASLGPQWCCSLGVACLQGRILVPTAKKMPMVTIPSPKTQARREALSHGLFFQRASVPAGGREDRRRGGRLGPCRWRICEGLGLQRRNPPPRGGGSHERPK